MTKIALGEAAGIEGEAMLASDVEARRWMHAEEAQAGFAALSPHLQENYRAYAAGFSRYFSDHPKSAPEWHFDFEPWHLIVIPRGLLWDVPGRISVGGQPGIGPPSMRCSPLMARRGLTPACVGGLPVASGNL
jgi:acyl-homoserine lactone acylase PvdQ